MSFFPSLSFQAVRWLSPVLLGQAFLFLLLFGGRALAAPTPQMSPHLAVKIDEGPGNFMLLFDMPAPSACPSGGCTGANERVMLAKLVVNGPPTHIEFQLEPSLGTNETVSFSTAETKKVMLVKGTVKAVATLLASIIVSGESGYQGLTDATKFRVLTIAVRFDNSYVFAADEHFTLRVKQTAAGARHFYGFRVDDAIDSTPDLAVAMPMVTKPHLVEHFEDAALETFPPPLLDFANPFVIDFGEVHIAPNDLYAQKEEYKFRNVGSGPLTFSGATPATLIGVYTVESYASPPDVLPMGEFKRGVTFCPTMEGPVPNAAVTLNTNAGDLQLSLNNGKGIRLHSAMVMDLSGSMLKNKDNGTPSEPSEQKIYKARFAALQLAITYEELLPEARMGLYSYPSMNDGACPSAEQYLPLSVIKNSIDDYKVRLNSSLPSNSLLEPHSTGTKTPLAEGIKRAREELLPFTTNSRRAVFLFGDGQHNCDSAASPKTPSEWYNSPQFQNDGIPFFTIPYGASGMGWFQTYNQIAANSLGTAFVADIENDVELGKQFKMALATALDAEILADPEANITAGGSASHFICTTRSAHQLVFSVDWALNNAEAVQVTVETPDHTLLTPTAPTEHPGHVGYFAGPTFANYVVRGKFLQGDAGSGIWKIHVKGNQATRYLYQSFAMDRMKTSATLDWRHLAEVPEVIVRFPGGPQAVAGAGITARIQRPTASFQNYLAKASVTPDEIARIPEDLATQWGPMEKKVYALQQAKKPFDPKWATEEKRFGDLETDAVDLIRKTVERPQPAAPTSAKAPATAAPTSAKAPATAASSAATAPAPGASSTSRALVAPLPKAIASAKGLGEDKVYKLPLDAAQVTGLHRTVVSVNGITANGQCFQREYSFDRFVDVKLSAGRIAKNLIWEDAKAKPFFPQDVVKALDQAPPERMVRKAITIKPTDDDGNFFGMGRADEIALVLKDATAASPLIDNYDGSYTQIVHYQRGTRPSVQVTVGDVKSDPISEPAAPPASGGGIPWFWILLALVVVILVAAFLRKQK